tara:strand:- start:147 stop:392 length:246 start_codon:yes stop_codon:yes gene_type:complete
MNRIDLNLKVEKIIREVLKIDDEFNIKEISIMNCENWDSLNHMVLISELSNLLGKELSPDEIMELTSVKNIFEFIKNNAKN